MERRRSKRYPRIPLEEAVSIVGHLHEKFGNASFDRDSLAVALGYSSGDSGSVTMRAAALVHYGLLRKSKRGYFLSELAQRICSPLTEEERIESLKLAALSPGLFREVFDSFSGDGRFPEMLHVLLVKDFGVARKVARKVDTLFRDSIAFAGLIDRDGAVASAESEGIVKRHPTDLGGKAPQTRQADEAATCAAASAEPEVSRYSFAIQGGSVEIIISGALCKKDLEKMRKHVELLELDVEE